MKKCKKFVSIALALVMVFGLLPFGAMADIGFPSLFVRAAAEDITVGDDLTLTYPGTAAKGEIIPVTATLHDAEGYESGTFKLTWDPDVFEYVSQTTEKVSGALVEGGKVSSSEASVAVIFWDSCTVSDLVLAEFSLEVVGDIGAESTLTFGVNGNDIEGVSKPAAVEGVFVVAEASADDPGKSSNVGDIDGDGFITSADSRLIYRYASRLEQIENEDLADLDGDGRARASDARCSLRAVTFIENLPGDSFAPVIRPDFDVPVAGANMIDVSVSSEDQNHGKITFAVSASRTQNLTDAAIFLKYDPAVLEFENIVITAPEAVCEGGLAEDGLISAAFVYYGSAYQDAELPIASVTFNVLDNINDASIEWTYTSWNGTAKKPSSGSVGIDLSSFSTGEKFPDDYITVGDTLTLTYPATAEKGDIIPVTAALHNAAGFSSGTFVLTWDQDVFKYVQQENGLFNDNNNIFPIQFVGGCISADKATVSVLTSIDYADSDLNLATFYLKVIGDVGWEGMLTFGVFDGDIDGVDEPAPAEGYFTVGESESADPDNMITVGDTLTLTYPAKAEKGTTIPVTAVLHDAVGFESGTFTLEWDPDVLEFVEVEEDQSAGFSMWTGGENTSGTAAISGFFTTSNTQSDLVLGVFYLTVVGDPGDGSTLLSGVWDSDISGVDEPAPVEGYFTVGESQSADPDDFITVGDILTMTYPGKAEKGAVIPVTVVLHDAVGFSSGTFSLKWDPDVLSFVSVEQDESANFTLWEGGKIAPDEATASGIFSTYNKQSDLVLAVYYLRVIGEPGDGSTLLFGVLDGDIDGVDEPVACEGYFIVAEEQPAEEETTSAPEIEEPTTKPEHVHTWNKGKVTKKATCETDGVKTYTCTECGEKKKEIIPALGHAFGDWEELDEDQHQKVCANDPSHVEVAAHRWNRGKVTKKAGCETEGVKTYTCKDCGAKKNEAIPAIGHDFGKWEKLDDEQHQRVCANDASHVETAEHTWNKGKVTKKATCETDGEKTFTCTDCGAKKIESIPATGHAFGDWKELNENEHQRVCANNRKHVETAPHTWDKGKVTKKATCVKDGEKVYTCKDCGATKEETIPATGHAFGAWEKLDDEQHQRVCANNAKHVETAAHEWDDGVISEDAVCQDVGTKVYTCKDCGAQKIEQLPATGHAFGDWEKLDDEQHRRVCANNPNHVETAAHEWEDKEIMTPATCQTVGSKTVVCKVCGATKIESIPAIGHAYGEWKKADDEQHQRVCANDPTHVETAPHEWDDGVITKEADCENNGMKTFTCADCGATKIESIPAIGHAYGKWEKVDNEKHKRVCANDPSHVETVAHTWNAGEVKKAAGCESVGEKLFVCTGCGATKTEPIPATGHAFGKWEKVDDETHKRVCANDPSHTETSGHNWDAGKVTKEAAPGVAGEKVYTCADCGATKTEVIPAKDIVSKDAEKAVVNVDSKHATIMPGISPDELKELLGGDVQILDAEGNPLAENKKVGTGAIIRTADGQEFTVVVPGDTDGDGKVGAADARKALRASAKLESLVGAFLKASDVVTDGKTKAADARAILRIAAKLDKITKDLLAAIM
ncbi:MAG: hypothetical protein IJK23_11725 [Clostridia bacterium]|nr:hypothetical protein [Clostridia bacterium]